MLHPPLEDTIVAVASAPGGGACAVVRLSGPSAVSALERLAPQGPSPGSAPGSRGFCVSPLPLVWALPLVWEGAPVPARFTLFPGPRSYTREDLVELYLPGVPALVAWALERLLARQDGAGDKGDEGEVRLAGPGEFTFRAFRSGRIDLSQAEAVASLISASSEAEGRAAERQLRGELRDRVQSVASGLLSALALVEAALDFPDEDLPEIRPAAVGERISATVSGIGSLLEASALRLPDGGALRVVLAGLPNAGKSSLLNALLGRPAAIVAGLAGTTRDPVKGVATAPGGRPLEWVDLAGFEDLPPDRAPPVEAPEEEASAGAAIARAVGRLTRGELAAAEAVVWVVDGSDPGSAGRSLELFRELSIPRKVLAVNKCDLLKARERARWRDLAERPVLVSALRGEGLADLGAAVEGGGPGLEALFLVTVRQAAALERARNAAERGRAAAVAGEGYELVAVELREALGALGEITGREVGEKVLEAIFSQFCIGK